MDETTALESLTQRQVIKDFDKRILNPQYYLMLQKKFKRTRDGMKKS